MSSQSDELPPVGAPATRALIAAGYSSLDQLADAPLQEIAALHGVGPKALRIIEAALAEHRARPAGTGPAEDSR